MVKKISAGAKNLLRRRQENAPEDEKKTNPLTIGTRHAIWAVALFTVAVLSILSFFNLAGQLGVWLDQGLTLLFGWGSFTIPLLLIIVGYILLVPEKAKISISTYLGLLLLIIAYSGLLHLFVPIKEAVSTVGEGQGGGYLGVILSYPLQRIMGLWATMVVLVALVLISVLIVFNTTLQQLAERGNIVGRFYNYLRDIVERIRFAFTRRSIDSIEEEPAESEESFTARAIKPEAVMEGSNNTVMTDEGQLEMLPKARTTPKKINLPLSLLENNHSKPTSGNIEENKRIIEKTLGNFGISVEMGVINVGPTVTQYTLKPAEGVKLAQIMTLQNDLSLALAAHPIRIEAPIPGKSLVGIEVPNESIALVSLKEVMESDEYKKAQEPLTFVLGKDVAGKPWVNDLDPLPHLMIAGATGSGKSVCINSLIVSLLYRNSPEKLKFIMVDPKRVELTSFNDIPHLLTPVITDVGKTVNALKWVVAEMDKRYQVLQDSGKRDIHAYHRDVNGDMPYIVVVIDELADIMAVAANEVEATITRLAQMARAVGIHLVVATQRPSVDVITGLIKANITARIAFNVVSLVDSRTILDTSGAEKLLGRGDMLFISSNLSKPKRIQGAHVSDQEIERVVKALKGANQPEYDMEVTEKPVPAPPGTIDDLGEDELLDEAQTVIMNAGKASASLLQRRLRIGYARAARILDLLEERGIIGPGEGAKPREILVSGPAAPTITESDDANEIAGEEEEESDEQIS
ncbi:MAG: DNA translocase FtsK 4TM domain-containing protein [Patescibacteria group bacterium]